MKRTLSLLLVIIITLSIFISCNDNEGSSGKKHVAPKMSDLDMTELSDVDMAVATDEVADHVIIFVEDYGRIVVRLFPDVAPETVENFKNLVSQKFYDGLIFHRVIEDFMIQGGGVTQSYTQKESASIKGEFSSNGVKNDLLHYRGVLSMARTSVKDSASSQFFIMHKTSPHLDGDYAAFGYVLAGMDVVDKIAVVETNGSNMPLEDVIIESIRFANKK